MINLVKKKGLCLFFNICLQDIAAAAIQLSFINISNTEITLFIVFKCKKISFLWLYPECPFHQGIKLNIIRFTNGFKAHGSVFRLTGGDIYVTTFVPKPIKYHILRIPHYTIFFLSWCFICDIINNTKTRKMLILSSVEKCWKKANVWCTAR